MHGWRRLLFGPGTQPRWARPALWALLLVTAVLYLYGLGASGNANSFYAAAVWAGTKSWKALFFGALDPGNAITVDKPPASLWVMALSGRIFGFGSWSMLVPQALEGVLSVGLLYSAVRRWFGPAAGLLGGFALAFTPVAALMFRFDNPDAMLVLLMVLACWAMVRALDADTAGRVRWVVLAGIAVGFAFLAKMMQGYVIIPALALTYLWAAPVSLGKRFLHLLWGALAIVVSTGWFVLAVALWPASARPFIGGSTNNSEWELALGYNGLGRVFGGDGNPGGTGGGPGGGAGGGGMFGGATGITRMFGSTFGGEISWLLPTALIALIALLVFTWRAPRTDRTRAAALLWGGWLVVNGVLFSFMSGIIHPYYTVALAPPIAALVGIGAAAMWRRRAVPWARMVLALMTAAAGIWAFFLLGRDASWLPWLRWALLVPALAGAMALVVAAQARRAVAVTAAVVSLVGGLGGSTAWAVATASQPHTGSIPTSGPSGASGGRGGFGGGMPGGGRTGASSEMRAYFEKMFGDRGAAGSGPARAAGGGTGGPDGGTADSALVKLLQKTNTRWAAAVTGSQQAAALELSGHKSVMAMGGFSGSDDSPTLAQFKAYVAKGEIHYLIAGGGMGGMGGMSGDGRGASGSTGSSGSAGSGMPGIPGGSGSGSAPGSGSGGGSTGRMPGGMGGMPGTTEGGAPGGTGEMPSGGSPRGERAGGGFGGGFGGGTGNEISQIESWAKAHYKTITVGGETVYDLTQPKS
ncbi:glycosyltransferase family 39 protein [Phaeacidiphilus oryzae]|uniref:glycosyltransferase family 39 protein n=1 Tax=Phaeacidiphilus oryzae TaxID=348818 RepID=UPI000690179D|nr:glycosyltransferase family 39 protein [Phaeacidiphilus oryzae]